jgi:hypothetical protein
VNTNIRNKPQKEKKRKKLQKTLGRKIHQKEKWEKKIIKNWFSN